MTDSVKIPLFKKADLDASIGVFFDGFSKVIVAVAILLGTFSLDGGTVFGTMMPGVLVTVLVMNGGLWLYYRHIAKSRGDANLTAVPAGLQAGRMFIWLYSIMLPVFNTTGDAEMAFKVGVLAHFIGGAVFIIGAFVVPLILSIVPAGALFGSLAGGAMAFLILQSMDGTLKMPLVGWLSLIVLFVIYLGKVNTKLPAALIAIVVGAGIAWATGSMSFSTVTDSLQNLNFYIPNVTFGIFSGDVISQTLPFLPIVIVFSLNEVITGIQAVEQAKECGDTFFTTTKPLVLCGVASSMVGALFGNPLAVGLYWGYPGWKKMGSGTGLPSGHCGALRPGGPDRPVRHHHRLHPRGCGAAHPGVCGHFQLLSGFRGGHQEVLPRGHYGLPARCDGLYDGQCGRGQAPGLLWPLTPVRRLWACW